MIDFCGWSIPEVINISSWSEIYDIEFEYYQGNHKSCSCQTLMAFDIETSNGYLASDGKVYSFNHDKYNTSEDYRNLIDNAESMSLLYVWQLAIETSYGPKVFIGRTWEEFEQFINMLTDEVRRQSVYGKPSIARLAENSTAKSMKHTVNLKIYIHNLGFEFQHLRNLFEDDFSYSKAYNGNVFARQPRKPMKCHIHRNRVLVEFRDTLVLTQKSLSSWGKDAKLPIQKLAEPKDYYLPIRTPDDTLTQEEINYSINDVVTMILGLKYYKDKYEKLSDIPLTQTGQVRAKCKEKVCIGDPDWASKCSTITQNYTPEDFKNLVQLFQGGWTHANKMYVGKTLKNIKCFDFASSYPAVMCRSTFPVEQFQTCGVNEFDELANQDIKNPTYRWWAKIKVSNVVSRLDNTYWSTSKVNIIDSKPAIKNYIADNGRVYACEEMVISLTDLDWDTFKQAYIYESIEVLELHKSEAGYLSTELIKTILEYYSYKTSLKGIPENESLYAESKQFCNGIYGCSVMKIISRIITFDDNGWEATEPTDEDFYKTIEGQKEDKTFLSYQCGIWVTAHARHNLWDFILRMDRRIVYCDTDSIKGLFTDEDMKFVEEYNKQVAADEDYVANLLGFDPSLFTPKTKKGVEKRLGIMEREDDCEEFRTLGAKRYVDLVDGEIHCTIAGLPKSAGKNKIHHVDDFTDKLVWNTVESEKNTAIYNDNQSPATWIGRDGKPYYSTDKYGICIKPTTFDLSISEEFRMFLQTLSTSKIDKDDEFFNDTPAYLI